LRDTHRVVSVRERIVVHEIDNTPMHPERSLARVTVAPGVTTALHAVTALETQRFLQGQGILEVDGRRHAVRRGVVVTIPPGTAQQVTNTGKGPLVFECTCQPRFTAERYVHLEP
jgi:mannose-6-phosphate isomerase-like protein (cupin superfamily)